MRWDRSSEHDFGMADIMSASIARFVGPSTVAVRNFSSPPLTGKSLFARASNTAIFSVTDHVLVRMVPVKRPEQLVMFTAALRHYASKLHKSFN
jgi:hypothetical protein